MIFVIKRILLKHSFIVEIMNISKKVENVVGKKKKMDSFILQQSIQPKVKSTTNKTMLNERKKRKKPQSTKFKKDIFDIHHEIMKLFEKEEKEIDRIDEEVERFEWIIHHTENESEKQEAQERFDKMKEKKYLIESGIRQAHYLYRAQPILNEYQTILNKPMQIDFMKNNNEKVTKEKEALIIQYINIAKNYIDIPPIEYFEKTYTCEHCQIELETADELLFVCPSCGYTVKNLASIASYQDNTRINNAQRYYYEKRVHFSDSIKKYQGKQNTTIHENVYHDLRKKIKNHEIPYNKLTKDHVYEFLKSTGHNEHYEDINLIYYNLTGNKPPDISHFEEKLFELFDEIDPIYERLKSEERVNFLNGQYVLFKFLQKLRYPCNEEDFYILKTRDTMLEHDQIWKKICEEKKWTFIPTV